MLKLLKYELRKTMPMKLITLGLLMLVEALFLYGVFFHKQDVALTGIILMFLGAIGTELMMGLGTIMTMHRDMNTKQSYMLFMTPNSTYKILGAKVIECLISILLIGALAFGICALDVSLLRNSFGSVSSAFRFLEELMAQFGAAFRTDTAFLASFTFGLLVSWLGMVTTALLADVISSAVLNGKKLGGLLTFLIFVVLLVIMGQLQSLAAGGPLAVSENAGLIKAGVALVWSGVMYVAAARIMDTKLSV